MAGEASHGLEMLKSLSVPDPAALTPQAELPLQVQSVEDFVPEDSLDRSFLEDPAPQRDKGRPGTKVRTDSDR